MKEILYVALVVGLAIVLAHVTTVDMRAEFERTERIEEVVESLPIQRALELQRTMGHD